MFKKRNMKFITISIMSFTVLCLIMFFNLNSIGFAKYDLEIPKQESVIENGYPVNENGQTYGPDIKDFIDVTPDLMLAEGEEGVIGYIYQDEGILSLDELDNYNASLNKKSIPLYLHDGKTIIGTFKFN